MKRVTYILILICLTFCSCSVENETANQNVVFHGVNMSIPLEWKENKNVKSETEMCFEEFGAYETEWKNLFSLVVYDGLIDNLDDGLKAMEMMFADSERYEIVDSGNLTIDGCPAKSITAKDIEEEGFHYKQTLLKNDKRYVLISLACKDEGTLQVYDQIIEHIKVE